MNAFKAQAVISIVVSTGTAWAWLQVGVPLNAWQMLQAAILAAVLALAVLRGMERKAHHLEQLPAAPKMRLYQDGSMLDLRGRIRECGNAALMSLVPTVIALLTALASSADIARGMLAWSACLLTYSLLWLPGIVRRMPASA